MRMELTRHARSASHTLAFVFGPPGRNATRTPSGTSNTTARAPAVAFGERPPPHHEQFGLDPVQVAAELAEAVMIYAAHVTARAEMDAARGV